MAHADGYEHCLAEVVRRVTTVGEAKAQFRLTCDGDRWGNVMCWLFTVAEHVHFDRSDMSVPEGWSYRPSPLGPSISDAEADLILPNLALMVRT